LRSWEEYHKFFFALEVVERKRRVEFFDRVRPPYEKFLDPRLL
jgi:hypothetical protein